MAQRSGVQGAWAAMQAVVAQVELGRERVAAQLPPGFSAPTAHTIFAGVRRQLKAWLAGLSAAGLLA